MTVSPLLSPLLSPLRLAVAALVLLAASRVSAAQGRGAIALGGIIDGLGVSGRVLVIGAHPDDEDTALLAWLVRGRHMEAAYLSLTRGDGGQNLIGNELGEPLGVIRTNELLAAREVDGARQYFTRAYDFGFSKSAEETFGHWQRDSLLQDIVTAVRAFRPHVIVSVFSGTPRDGHGQHQAAGILAREAYDVAMDTVRFPRAVTSGSGPWTPLKFYRSARFSRESATLSFNVGEYDPLRGRSYYEIAAESRSQHKSQGFGVLQRKGVVLDHVRREDSRVNAGTPAGAESDIFDGIDTTWARIRPLVVDAAARAALDSIPPAVATVREAYDPFVPATTLAALGRVNTLLRRAWCGEGSTRCITDTVDPIPSVAHPVPADVEGSLTNGLRRVGHALLAAAGVSVEATVPRDVVALGDSAAVEITLYNRGTEPVRLVEIFQIGDDTRAASLRPQRPVQIEPDSAHEVTLSVDGLRWTRPRWLVPPRKGDMFGVAGGSEATAAHTAAARVALIIDIAGTRVWAHAPVVFRYADPVRGDVRRPLAVVPAISITLDRTIEYARAGEGFERTVRVHLRSSDNDERRVIVSLELPGGFSADSALRTLMLAGGATRTVDFVVRGRPREGSHVIRAVAESNGVRFGDGFIPIVYDHILPARVYRPAELLLEAVDVELPAGIAVAYLTGVGDNIVPMLRQLGLDPRVIEPGALVNVDLSRFGVVVVGPRAYDASPELAANNRRLLEYAREGGTLVVQYGQYEMTRSGIMPYPITLERPHTRVTDEHAKVRLLDPQHALLQRPNRITADDFDGWVQERALYMPATFSDHYTTVLAVADPGEPASESAILVVPYGRGTYIYTTLAFFRQLPAGVPGAARLFVNLLAAGATSRGAATIAP
ncbi:MAG: PIG-L family deacetylase [Gemmatimonadaceae bacterium]